MNDHKEVTKLYAETTSGATAELVARREFHYNRRFLTMFEETLAELARQKRPATYFRVCLAVIGRLDPIQFRRLSAREIAEETLISKISVERSLSQMERDKVLIGKGRGAGKALRLNTWLASKSRADRYIQAVQEANDPRPFEA